MTKRNEKTSPAVTRDASAILNFKAKPFIDADTGIECVTVPMTYIRRARRVASSVLPRRQIANVRSVNLAPDAEVVSGYSPRVQMKSQQCRRSQRSIGDG